MKKKSRAAKITTSNEYLLPGNETNQYKSAFPRSLNESYDSAPGLTKLEYAVLILSTGKVTEIRDVEAYAIQATKVAQAILFETSKYGG